MVVEEVVARIVKHLKDAGYRAVSRSIGDCYVISAQRGDRAYVVSVSRGSMVDVYVAKVTAPEYLPGFEWSCEQVEYSPYGFYVLEEDPEKLVLGVAKKLELLDRVYRAK
ncbi:MAG: hypothetical protein QXU65_06155 [Sulfolobales archaeon]